MQFVQQVEYPKDFPALMMDFSREVLREQPENIYEFAVKHFTTIKKAQVGQQ
ncbi:Regulatory subunit of type II PKA R-subunit [Spironucleus salmonicida]|uniref:Flagellar radial spoke protein n=1 Tax=Spironucleus salmonicida TaxID=348837 RepID=V6LQN9_9EUKA|nr:Regulatory subunit of type II PKA R-subunit [Spironucleus salmonicida]|eukprot:EST46992.1 Flagellar radial spoke protein [Spironucleus salmonicida]